MSLPIRYVLFAALAISLSLLYLYNLDGVGVLGPDEPRYAAIGRTMAATRDFVTPQLWGKPWFEKPPLLYWMTALGTGLGLNKDLCARLPIAVLSLIFLAAMLSFTALEFGFSSGLIAVTTLATSAGWLSSSGLGLTDLPLAVFFSLAILLVLPLLRDEPTPPQKLQLARHSYLRFALLGVCLGCAMLAKGLVPVALAVPFVWFLRRYWRQSWITLLTLLLTAGPWYVLVYARNGSAFLDDFLIKQHFQRLYSASLAHIQPWYYYLPVLLAALFPWTPLLGLFLRSAKTWSTQRLFLLSVILFGLFFFSVSRNKLPGYLLPLLPSFFLLLAPHIRDQIRAGFSRGWLVSCAILVGTIPLMPTVLPPVLAAGKLSGTIPGRFAPSMIVMALLPVLAACGLPRYWAAITLVASVIVGAMYLKAVTYPVLDRTVSARSLWKTTAATADRTCDGGTNRDWLYGLQYYRGSSFPTCEHGHFDFVLRTHRRGAPDLDPLP